MWVIKRFGIGTDYRKLGFCLYEVINLKFIHNDFKKFINNLPKLPEIVHGKRITGGYCIMTDCVLQDSTHLAEMIGRLILYGIPNTSIQLLEIEAGNSLRIENHYLTEAGFSVRRLLSCATSVI